MKLSSGIWLPGILLAAAVLRFAAVPIAHNQGLISDEREYLFLATRLQQGGPFIDSNGDASVRSPLFPALLSLVPGIAEGGAAIPLMLECLVGVLAVFLVYRLALTLWQSEDAALVAAGTAAFHPGLVVYSALLLTEMPFVVMVLTVLLLARRLPESPRLRDAVLMGMVAGLATLTRAVFLFPFFLLVVWLCRAYQKGRQSSARSTMVGLIPLVVCLAVLAPWTIRNYQVHRAFMPVSSFGGTSLLWGNNPYTHGTVMFDPGFEAWYQGQLLERGVADARLLSERERSVVDRQIALEYMASHPWDSLRLGIQKAYVFWVYPLSHQESNTPLQLAAVAADVLLYLAAASGIGIAWHFRRRLGLLWVPILGFTLVHLVLHSEARYRFPVVPLVCVLAGGAAVAWEHRQAFVMDKGALRVSLVLGGLIAGVYALTAVLFVFGRI